jgi:hypothetical protein
MVVAVYTSGDDSDDVTAAPSESKTYRTRPPLGPSISDSELYDDYNMY